MKSEIIEKEKISKKFYGLKYDKVFKAVFLVPDREGRYKLLEKLLSEILEGEVIIKKLVPTEISVRSYVERCKRLDALIELDGRKVNLELNSQYNKVTKIRNLRYFMGFISTDTEVNKAYDGEMEYIHISLNYYGKEKEKLNIQKAEKNEYMLYDKKNEEVLEEKIKYIEVNIDKYANFWYTKKEEEIKKSPILILCGIDSEEEIEEYRKYIKIEEVEGICRKMSMINKDGVFIYDISPEEEERIYNEAVLRVAIKDARKEAAEEGKKEGLEKGKIEGTKEATNSIVKNMINNNFTIEQILEVTNLTLEEIEEIKKSICK